MDLENAEEILQILERYTKQKSKTIPDELNSYLRFVALTGDSVYSWSKVQYFFREKLAHVIKEFHDTTPRTDLPVSRNVDAFNYDSLKTTLLERFDLFNAAPFTIQRLSELLNEPKKHYCRLDKFMRALEKNILVVSTVEPGHRQMGSENGDSINGDPLMDINVDVEMDKEPSGSMSPTEKKTIEAQPEPSSKESSTENKTEQGTSEQCEELPSGDAKVSTNGHHNNDLEEKIVEDAKAKDQQTLEASDKTDISPGIETITVEVQPAEIGEKVNSPEPSEDVSQPTIETLETTPSSLEQPNEPTVDDVKPSEEKTTSENETGSNVVLKEELTMNSVEKEPQNNTESVKHSRDDDGEEEEDCQPTAAKVSKMDEPTAEAEVLPESDKVDIGKVDVVPAKDTHPEDQSASEIKGEEVLPEPVLEEVNAATPIVQLGEIPVDDQPVVEEPAVNEQPIVEQEEAAVEEQTIDEPTAVIPKENVQSEIIDESNNDTTSTDNTISPLASTISNDLDILEEDEELIEPIIADTETLEPSTLAETDVEMLPLKTVDSAEQMAVEDPTPVLTSGNSDLAMDATQIIPSTTDEQMDVLENNLMDEDL